MSAHSSFSLYQKSLKGKILWYARFWNDETESYSVSKSTGIPCVGKKGRRPEAFEVARGMVAEIAKAKEPPLFLTYIEAFWKSDSPYIRSKAKVAKKPLSLEYILNNQSGIEKWVKPYPPFQKMKLDKIKPGIIEDWKLWACEKGIGAPRLNSVIKSLRVAVRVAVSRGELAKDPFANIKNLPEERAEKGILNPNEVKAILAVEEHDPRVKAGIFLALLCGLRRGEIRGLRWQDIDENAGIISICHNFVRFEGDKNPKWNSTRKVILPIQVKTAIESIRSLYESIELDGYILENLPSRSPIAEVTLKRGFARMLASIGIDAQAMKSRNISLHSCRHCFVTLCRSAGLSDIDVMTLSGHRSPEMMQRYSHGAQIIDLQAARRAMEGQLQAGNQ